MDRLEQFLQSGVVEGLTGGERASLRLVGLLIPVLLFADDLVVLGSSGVVVQRLLDGLGHFCSANGLRVNLPKTKWLLGGWTAAAGPNPVLRFEGAEVARVDSFRYLGLELSGGRSLTLMREARLTAARRAWGVL